MVHTQEVFKITFGSVKSILGEELLTRTSSKRSICTMLRDENHTLYYSNMKSIKNDNFTVRAPSLSSTSVSIHFEMII